MLTKENYKDAFIKNMFGLINNIDESIKLVTSNDNASLTSDPLEGMNFIFKPSDRFTYQAWLADFQDDVNNINFSCEIIIAVRGDDILTIEIKNTRNRSGRSGVYGEHHFNRKVKGWPLAFIMWIREFVLQFDH